MLNFNTISITNEQKAKDYCSKHYLREGYATRGSFEKAMIAMAKWKDKQFTEKKKEIFTIIEALSLNENNQATIGQQYADIATQLEEMSLLQCYQLGIMHGANTLIKQIWHKESEHPNNRHPYPVLNPDGEMAFAFYDELYG